MTSVVVNAMVPHALAFRSTLSELIKMPARAGVVRNSFLFPFAPRGTIDLSNELNSTTEPSIPTKLSMEPATATVNGPSVLFLIR